MAPKSPSLPLYEVKYRNNIVSRAIELFILLLLFILLGYRIITLKDHGFQWLLALICESWFTFVWILTISTKWNQIEPITYPQRLLEWTSEFPAVDIFVTTADPALEPPLITINTVLSLLAVDYPANKLACYVSDDGASFVTYYSLVEASKFAKLWVPFCKKYNIGLRAPFRYFSVHSTPPQNCAHEFLDEWKKMKDEYLRLCEKIEDASHETETCDFSVFADIDRKNHPTIIKVIWENKEGLVDGLPHLVYISREKRPKHPHNFKAGAMNVLTRVSGVMTNAPLMLNMDCDMYANNPQLVLHAMCYFLGTKDEKDCGFVQFPQYFYDGLKDDPYGNQLKVLHEYIGRGIASIQGPTYQGTGCFHRRKVIYGLSPNHKINAGELKDEYLQKFCGKSQKLISSVSKTLLRRGSDIIEQDNSDSLSSSIEVAHQVGSCGYEFGTNWGQKLGWLYGSATEDLLTGLSIHGRGWRSAYCIPDPPGFLGCAPSGGPASMVQQKRWATGLLEVLLSSKSPIVGTLFGKLQLRQCMAYLWIQLWPLRSIFETCYATLPSYCVITNSRLLPKANESMLVVPVSIFIIYNLYCLTEYVRANVSIRTWWNNQRMWRVHAMSAWLFAVPSVTLKFIGLSEITFEVTKKESEKEGDDTNTDGGRFTFDDSPYFLPGTTILFLNLSALLIGLLDFKQRGREWGLGEIVCIVLIVLIFWAFLKGLFGKGKYGIPSSTVLKSGALALLLVQIFKLYQ